MNSELVTFNDVLIAPKFSNINSRKDVSLSTSITKNWYLDLPILSANMDSISGSEMCMALAKQGGLGILHRFWSIEDNVKAYNEVKSAGYEAGGSIGLGENEFKRAIGLFEAGCTFLVLDVAHGAQMAVVKQYDLLKQKLGDNITLVVGNFATSETIREFSKHLGYDPDVVKIGIGPGAACTTRIKTGVGIPQLSAIADCNLVGIPIIADGGIKSSGDIAKALGAGAKAVMVGSLLAGTDETPGEIELVRHYNSHDGHNQINTAYKIYRGSASKESYQDQGKDNKCPEGESFKVKCKGPVEPILQELAGGLRSSFSYVGASTLQEFQSKVEFFKVSSNTILENGAHGSTK